jgi:hypothetical protein
MSDDAIGVIIFVVTFVLTGAVSTWLFRLAAAKHASSGIVRIVVWLRSGRVPGLARQKKWTRAKVSVDESDRLVRVKPPGEPLAITLRSRDSRPRDKRDLWAFDLGHSGLLDGQGLGSS